MHIVHWVHCPAWRFEKWRTTIDLLVKKSTKSFSCYILIMLILSLCIAPPHIKIKERTTTFFFFCKNLQLLAPFSLLYSNCKGRIWYISPAFGFFRSLRQQQFTTWMHRVIKLLGSSHHPVPLPTTQVELKWAPELLLMLVMDWNQVPETRVTTYGFWKCHGEMGLRQVE